MQDVTPSSPILQVQDLELELSIVYMFVLPKGAKTARASSFLHLSRPICKTTLKRWNVFTTKIYRLDTESCIYQTHCPESISVLQKNYGGNMFFRLRNWAKTPEPNFAPASCAGIRFAEGRESSGWSGWHYETSWLPHVQTLFCDSSVWKWR